METTYDSLCSDTIKLLKHSRRHNIDNLSVLVTHLQRLKNSPSIEYLKYALDHNIVDIVALGNFCKTLTVIKRFNKKLKKRINNGNKRSSTNR